MLRVIAFTILLYHSPVFGYSCFDCEGTQEGKHICYNGGYPLRVDGNEVKAMQTVDTHDACVVVELDDWTKSVHLKSDFRKRTTLYALRQDDTTITCGDDCKTVNGIEVCGPGLFAPHHTIATIANMKAKVYCCFSNDCNYVNSPQSSIADTDNSSDTFALALLLWLLFMLIVWFLVLMVVFGYLPCRCIY